VPFIGRGGSSPPSDTQIWDTSHRIRPVGDSPAAAGPRILWLPPPSTGASSPPRRTHRARHRRRRRGRSPPAGARAHASSVDVRSDVRSGSETPVPSPSGGVSVPASSPSPLEISRTRRSSTPRTRRGVSTVRVGRVERIAGLRGPAAEEGSGFHVALAPRARGGIDRPPADARIYSSRSAAQGASAWNNTGEALPEKTWAFTDELDVATSGTSRNHELFVREDLESVRQPSSPLNRGIR
jgi:hypothetical protein